jgi:hypothetical protein
MVDSSPPRTAADCRAEAERVRCEALSASNDVRRYLLELAEAYERLAERLEEAGH